jgi:hypothetical protein
MYKLENGSLYQLQKDALGGECWMHVYKCSSKVKTLAAAVSEFVELSLIRLELT